MKTLETSNSPLMVRPQVWFTTERLSGTRLTKFSSCRPATPDQKATNSTINSLTITRENNPRISRERHIRWALSILNIRSSHSSNNYCNSHSSYKISTKGKGISCRCLNACPIVILESGIKATTEAVQEAKTNTSILTINTHLLTKPKIPDKGMLAGIIITTHIDIIIMIRGSLCRILKHTMFFH